MNSPAATLNADGHPPPHATPHSTAWSGLNATPGAFPALFTHFTRSAFRLENRRAYGVADEDAPFQAWLAGDDPDIAWLHPWLETIQTHTRAGRTVRRVRLVDDPPSDYLRWEIAVTPHNLAAGEDIRYLPRTVTRGLHLPPYDFWLFDTRLLAALAFTEDDRFLGFRTSTHPHLLRGAARARATAWRQAAPYTHLTHQGNRP